MRLLPYLLFLSCCLAGAARAATITVSPTGPLRSIAQAVQQAQPGDRILVKKGVYREGEIKIEKALTLEGEGYPVLDGNGNSQLLTVLVKNVTIKGMHLRNTGSSSLHDLAGIKVLTTSHATILNNKLENCFFGIYLQRSDSCTVRGNEVITTDVPETMRANGIHMWKCAHIQVEGNHVQGQRDGIYLEFTTYSTMKENLSEQNIRYGLHFMFSDNDVYSHNTFRNNGAGVAVMYTHGVEMTHNIFEYNWGSAAYGLLLKDISRSTIHHNTFRKNTCGIYLEGSSSIKVQNNSFDNNGWAVKLLANCSEDTFALNNFSANTFDVATNGMTVLNHFQGNYWDKYQGYDLNKDRVGDVPYRPVSLYTVLVERVPYSVMFLRSFIVDLMDRMEKVIPSFTPDQLMDEQPAMAYLTTAGASVAPPAQQPVAASSLPATASTPRISFASTFSSFRTYCLRLFGIKDSKAPVAGIVFRQQGTNHC